MKTNAPYDVTGLNPAEAAAAAGSDAVIPSEDIIVEETVAPEYETAAPPVNTVDVVTDNMTFAEAFAAARAEYGAGATFTWHGQIYGTYYQNEWNAMTPAEQQAFTAAALGADPVETPLEVMVDDSDYVQADTTTDDIADDDFEVRVLGYDSYENDGQQYNIAALSVGDEPVFMIDLDNDNVYDIAIADFDGSDSILDSADDIRHITDLALTTDEIAALDSGEITEPVDPSCDDMAAMDIM